MHIASAVRNGRRGWLLSSDCLSLFVLAGGGHLAEVRHAVRPEINPYWAPHWKTMEPWEYRSEMNARYGEKLLAGIMGHNLCLGAFGTPSEEETRAGLGCHYEAPVVRWRMLSKRVGRIALTFAYGCRLPIAQLDFVRTLRLRAGSGIIRVRDTVSNYSRRDLPFTMCQHVTLGAPFLQEKATLFDLSATRSHTYPSQFGPAHRLEPDCAFKWPLAPGKKGGQVDLRRFGRAPHSDFSTHLTPNSTPTSWFSAVNPELGLMLAYAWQSVDFPWLGLWEENRGRANPPWNGREAARGMEFSNTPFPVGLRQAVERHTFQRQPTFRWLPARGRQHFEYSIIMAPVAADCRGVANIVPAGSGYMVAYL